MIPDTPSLSIYEQLVSLCGEVLSRAGSAGSRDPWRSRFTLFAEDAAKGEQVDGLTVTLQLGGELIGDLELCLDSTFAGSFLPEGSNGGAGAWLSMLQAAVPEFETALGSSFGKVTVEECRLGRTPETVAFGEIVLTRTDQASGRVRVLASPQLRVSLARRASERAELLPVGEGGHLHRVIDVPLSVTLRFGQRQLTLRELLALSTGSLVELDRQVEEPVDLMLGERIVARGEVVIVDGNYGMRVTQIVENTPHRHIGNR